MNIKAIAVRALKTFVQVFLATIAAGVVGVVTVEGGKALVVAAFAAAISAAMNVFIQPSEAK